MNLLKKIINRVNQKLLSEVLKIISKQNEKFFELLFNLYSKFVKSVKVKVKFISPNYYVIDKDKKYKFFPIERIKFYAKGLDYRFKILREEYLLENIKFKDDDIIIDTGANNGDFYYCFNQKIEYNGFEPSPVVFKNLEYNVKNQNLYQLGLWKNSNEKIEFYLKDKSGDSSMIPINNYEKKIYINTITLDEVINKINKNIKLIKLEAEGAEPEILSGLVKNLNKVEYLTIDCGFERGVKLESTIADCTNYLLKNNFKMVQFAKYRTVVLFKNNSFL